MIHLDSKTFQELIFFRFWQMELKLLELLPRRFLAQKLRRMPTLVRVYMKIAFFLFSPRKLQEENANNFAFNLNESNTTKCC